jgi:hypothetical protein
VAENNCLRQEVDHLRLERASFDRIYSKMEKEFKTKVESISVLQNSIAELEGERALLKSHLHGLKSTADAKQKTFGNETLALKPALPNPNPNPNPYPNLYPNLNPPPNSLTLRGKISENSDGS